MNTGVYEVPGRAPATPYVDPAPPNRTLRWTVLAVLLAGVAALVSYLWYATQPHVVPTLGMVYDGHGRLIADDDRLVMDFSGRAIPYVTMRLPVVNTGRLPVTVTYPADLHHPNPDPSDEPVRTVRIAPGRTAWLELADSSRGCAGTPAGNSYVITSSVRVTVRAAGGGVSEYALALPVPYRKPGFQYPNPCLEGAR